MPISEFDLIGRYFFSNQNRSDVVLGIGDDCAILNPEPDKQLVISMDTMVQGVHFSEDASPSDIGYKLAAVNLSDMAAMGASPAWATLALTLPESNESWIREFSGALFQLLNEHGVQLIGGDTTRGPLSVTMQIHGYVEIGRAVTRSGARCGDKIYVSGTLGDAALALQAMKGSESVNEEMFQLLLQRLHRPQPRVVLGRALEGLATSMIDISDGLLGDLGHILHKSDVGAIVDTRQLPLSHAFSRSISLNDGWHYALSGGDDYELCFTVSPENEKQLTKISQTTGVTCKCVGEIIEEGFSMIMPNGDVERVEVKGYQHFE